MEEKNEPFFIQHHYDRLFKTIEDDWKKKMNRFLSNINMIGCLKQLEEKKEPFFIQHHYDRLFKTIEDEWRKKMNRFSSNIIMIGCLKQLRMSGGKK